MEQSAPESVKQLIRKIHTLSLRGIGGEAETAKRKLDELLLEHGISIDDIVTDAATTHKFRFKSIQERKLILQCYWSMGLDGGVFTFSRRGKKVASVLGLDLTPAQYVDLSGMVEYYKKALKAETDRLLVAFIQKHRLFPPINGKTCDSDPMDIEELEQLLAMMRGLGEKSYFKPSGYLSA